MKKGCQNEWKSEEEIIEWMNRECNNKEKVFQSLNKDEETLRKNIKRMRKTIERAKTEFTHLFIPEDMVKENIKWYKVIEGTWLGGGKGGIHTFSNRWELKDENEFQLDLWEEGMYLEHYWQNRDDPGDWGMTDNFMRDKFFEIYYLYRRIDWYGYKTTIDASNPFAVLYADYENGFIFMKHLKSAKIQNMHIRKIYEGNIKWLQIKPSYGDRFYD